MDLTEEWRKGNVEERLEYALVKVTAYLLISTFFAIIDLHIHPFKQLSK